MKNLITTLILLILFSCDSNHNVKVIIHKSYKNGNDMFIGNGFCRFGYKLKPFNSTTYFTDKCYRYNLLDSVHKPKNMK